MSLVVESLLNSSQITDCCFIPEFSTSDSNIYDCLAIACGNQLIIYLIIDGIPQNPQSFEIYGEIARIIPLHYSHEAQSTLFIILKDYRTSIVRMDFNDQLIYESLGNLLPVNHNNLLPFPNYALHPTCLVLQIDPNHLPNLYRFQYYYQI